MDDLDLDHEIVTFTDKQCPVNKFINTALKYWPRACAAALRRSCFTGAGVFVGLKCRVMNVSRQQIVSVWSISPPYCCLDTRTGL